MKTFPTHSPALVLMTVEGRRVPVCGKDMSRALWATALVDTVLRRGKEVPLPASRTGGTVKVRLNGTALARFLRNVYLNDAGAVAEAVMALRKFDRARAAWLLRVLQQGRGLAELARAVQVELTGEEPAAGTGTAG